MFNKKVIIDSLRNLSKPSKISNKNSFDFEDKGIKKEGFISAQEGVDTPIYKAVKVGASPIEGKGLFADQAIRKGDVIGISHIRQKFMKNGEEYQAPFPSTVLGYYNHSEEPNVYEVDNGDHILMVAGRDIQRGQELTSDYSKHNIEDLEVPEDFKRGGSTKRPKMPKGKSPRSYSRSLEATNKLFTEHPFFAKPKSRKNKIYDPRAQYYAKGGIPYNYNPFTSVDPEAEETPIPFNPIRTENDPEDYNQFLEYSESAPENRRPYSFYGDPNEYDHYGMWDALGKPKNFEEALQMNPDWQPDPYDGYYHGFSVNPNTGVFLKSGKPGFKEGDTTWMEINGHYLSPRANESTPVYDPDLQRFKYIPKEEDGGEKDKWGRPKGSKWYGFDPKTNTWTLANKKTNKTKIPKVSKYPRLEEDIIDPLLGSPQKKGAKFANGLDNLRHSMASYYTAKGLQPYLGAPASIIGANVLGAAHEVKRIFDDPDDWSTKLRTSGEDMFNNVVGSAMSILPESWAKGSLKYLSDNNLLPDGVDYEGRDLYVKEYGGLTQYEPGGYSDEPPGSKKKPYKDSKAILPRWMPKGMVKAIQNTEVGISPYSSNIQSWPTGLVKDFDNTIDVVADKDDDNNFGKYISVSRPGAFLTTETGLGKKKVHDYKQPGWTLSTKIGKPYNDETGDMIGSGIERWGNDAYDARWNEYYEDLADYNAGTMAPSMLWNGDGKGWDPEKNKPKYDGKLARGLGRAMQKAPVIGGVALNYHHPKLGQPHGYNAGGHGKISLDFDPNNQVGLGLEGGIDFYGGNRYQSKNYRPGNYRWNISPSVTGALGTRPHFGFNVNAGIEGLPGFMPKKFPGYFYGNANYNQSLLLGSPTFSANVGYKLPLNQYKQRRAQKRVEEKEKEDNIVPSNTRNTTYEYGGIPLELNKDEIQKYVDGGYIVEELPKASRGREKKAYVAPKINEVQFKPVEIQTYNPKLKEYQIHTAELPDRIVPGREYADVKHKMASLRKDLGISGFEHLMNKYIPGAAHPISLVKDSGIVIDPATGKLFDSNTRYWLNREYGFEPSIDQFFQQMSGRLANDYGKLIMSSDTPFENRKMGINYMDEFASPYTQKNGLLNLFGEPTGGPLMIGMGMIGKPEFNKEIKNPDYFTQLLNTYDTKRLSYSSRKYYQDLINSVKNQNGLATERQYNELQRLKTGDFDFGKRGYAHGGLVKASKGRSVKTIKDLGRATNITTFGTANTLGKTFAPVMMHPARIPMLGGRIENLGAFTGSPLNVLPFYGKKIESTPDAAFRKFGDTLDFVKMSGQLSPADGPLIRMGKNQIMEEGNWAALNQPNEWYPGVMSAKFDFNAPGGNLGFTKIRDRDGVLITDAQGNRMPAIPISEPGLSFQRRLPFSNRYVDVNMEKLRNNQFDISTVGTNTQALLERYGYGMGYAALLGAMGLSAPKQIIDDYINKPIMEGYNKYVKPGFETMQDVLKPKRFRMTEDGSYEEYAKGGLVKFVSGGSNDCPDGYIKDENGNCIPSNYDPNIANENTEFLKSMANSPLFTERYARMVGKPIEEVTQEADDYRKQILQNLETVQMGDSAYPPEPYGESTGAYYWHNPTLDEYAQKLNEIQTLMNNIPNKGKFNKELKTRYQEHYDKAKKDYDNQLKTDHKVYFKNWNKPYDLHERSHASVVGELEVAKPYKFKDLSQKSHLEKLIFDNLYPPNQQNYYESADEIKSAKDVSAEVLMKLGLYDPINENFTPEHYKKLIELRKSGKLDPETEGQIDRITTPFDEEETIRMFNDIVQNESDNDIQYGEYGGELELGDEIELTKKQVAELKKYGYTLEQI